MEKVERIAKVLLVDRKQAFLAQDTVTSSSKVDPLVDALECNGYEVQVVKTMSLNVSEGFFSLVVYFRKPHCRKSYLGNDRIEAESMTYYPDDSPS